MTSRSPLPPAALATETAWVHQLARHLVRDEHLAADVAQDALVVGLDGAAPEAPATPPRGWLAGITRRLALQAVRKRRERQVRELLAARTLDPDPEHRTAERLRVHELLTRAVRELPEPYRTAVALRFFEGHAPRVIAKLRGQTAETVRQHVHRGLGMLRQRLDAEFGERRAWLALFADVGLLLPAPHGGGLRWPAAPTLALAAGLLVAALAAAAVVATAWSRRGGSAGAATDVPANVAPPTAPPSAPIVADDPSQWSSAPEQEPRAAAGGVPRSAEEITTRVDRYLEPLVRMGVFSGAVLLARGDVVVQRAYGLADHAAARANTVDTRFKLMSTSKPLTATAVLRLVQAGRLALTDRVGAHLPEWPAAWADVTVHDLLDHTSGVPNLEQEWGAVARRRGERGLAVWRALAPELAARPGLARVAPHYGNFSYELAGCVAEAVAGQPYRELLAREVLGPARLTATGVDDGSRAPQLATGYFFGAAAPRASEQDMSVIQAAGGSWSTVGDLYRLDRALRGDTLLDAATRALQTTPRDGAHGYACGWNTQPVLGRRCWHHSGGANGYVANLLRFPDDDACVVVLSNFAFAPVTRLGTDLAAVLFGLAHDVAVGLESAALDASTGFFVDATNPARCVLVRRAGERLLAFDVWPNGERVGGHVLVPVAAGRFVPPFGAGHWTVDADGLRTPRGTLVRREPAAARWRELAGAWNPRASLSPGELQERGAVAASATLRARGDALVLELEGGWPASVDVVPLGPDLALGLVAEEFGTLLHRDGDTVRWTRADGTSVTFTPSK